MAEGDDAAKDHEPTQKRLDDARERGEVARSPDLATAASYGGLLIAALVAGPGGLQAVGQICAVLLDQADRLSAEMREGGAAPIAQMSLVVGQAVAPFFLFPAAGVVIAILLQQSLIFTPDKLAPKLSRLSPVAALTQKFGRDGLFEFGKSMVKLFILSACLGVLLVVRMEEILTTLWLDPAMATVVLLDFSVEFLMIVLGLALVFGVLDYLWQRAQHLRRNRMSHQEMIEEFKQSEGDPHFKAQRRQRGQELAMNRMLVDVANADVVIVNPTHYAVALRWHRDGNSAPVCVAKGVDEVAACIRARAAEAGVPIHRDAPTARALFAAMEIGAEIRPDQYRAVAAAIRFSDMMRKKARRR